ncbi:hypothetical protein AVEN_118574-1 [Araneus ventricosus]|uniref:Uncharacterized protein n=1 Tax=Araneus ventricosus TaxID=182803 RepID=A0A4Y2AYQ9_ARAVE|nr:hypothetical protein AVEN_118574-1 [Araneus ventricosus]
MDTDDNNAFPGYSRKRMKKKTWKKVEAKKKRNSSEEYVSRYTNTVVPARQIGIDHELSAFVLRFSAWQKNNLNQL